MTKNHYLAVAVIAISTAGCTTVGNPGPNEQLPECSPDQQRVCSGATGRRTGRGKDPHSVCGCADRVDRM